MPVGLEVTNESLAIQIDGESPNLVLQAKGTGDGQVTFASPERPMVFIRPTAGDGGYPTFLRNNGNGTWTYGIANRLGGGSEPFSFWAYCQMNPSENPGFGLQIFNASGVQVYASHRKPLRIVDVISLPVPPEPSPWYGPAAYHIASYYQYAGGNYAFAIGQTRHHETFVDGYGSFPSEILTHREAVRATATGYEVWAKFVYRENYPFFHDSLWSDSPAQPKLIVANVSNQ